MASLSLLRCMRSPCSCGGPAGSWFSNTSNSKEVRVWSSKAVAKFWHCFRSSCKSNRKSNFNQLCKSERNRYAKSWLNIGLAAGVIRVEWRGYSIQQADVMRNVIVYITCWLHCNWISANIDSQKHAKHNRIIQNSC